MILSLLSEITCEEKFFIINGNISFVRNPALENIKFLKPMSIKVSAAEVSNWFLLSLVANLPTKVIALRTGANSSLIRLISSRKATKRERGQYAERIRF